MNDYYSVMLCWETVGPGIYVDATLTSTDHLHHITEQVPKGSAANLSLFSLPLSLCFAAEGKNYSDKYFYGGNTPISLFQPDISLEWQRSWQESININIWLEIQVVSFFFLFNIYLYLSYFCGREIHEV